MNPTENEVIDTFYHKYSNSLSTVLTHIIDDLKEKGIPILNNTNHETTHDFLELILYNINLQDIYKNNII